jgi:serine/threonine-protein kinase
MSDVLATLRDALADRYTVVGEIGRGGMATVLLATEHHPSRQVAIKVFDPSLARGMARERFLREVDLSAKLTHPHIVPIYAAGEAGECLYYVMPYLAGESLRQRLADQGGFPLPVEEAVHLAADVADALGYAHAQGVIHRDIKPENILISEGHAVVADFGVARAISAADAEHTLTQAGFVVGTPQYMAPEQATGGRSLDIRADIYSLGCVLYEMLVGQPPNASTEQRSARSGRISNAPDEHRSRLSRIPRGVEQVVAKAIAFNPEDRFRTAAELAAALMGTGHLHSGITPARVSRRRTVKQLAVGAAAVVGLAAAAWVLRGGERRFGLDPDRVVVAPFANETGDPGLDPLGRMAADWITQGITQRGLAEVVSYGSASGAEREEGKRGASAALALGRSTRAGRVIWGAYYHQGRNLQFQAQVTDARDGRVLSAVPPVTAPTDAPMEAVNLLRERVMSVLAILMNREGAFASASSAGPPRFDAYQEFLDGLAAFNRADFSEAIRHLVRATQLDTSFTSAGLWVALAYINIGGYRAADSVASSLGRAADRLTPFDRLFLNYVRAIIRGDRQEALRAAREGTRLAPGSEAAFAAGEAALHLNRPREALEHLRSLDPERGWIRSWPAYWHALSSAYHLLGDHARELREVRRGRRLHAGDLFLAYAELRALAALGRAEDVGPTLEEVLSSVAGSSHRLPSGELLVSTALALRAYGDSAGARLLLERAAGWAESLPEDVRRSEPARFGLAQVRTLLGDLVAAREMLEQLTRERPDSVSYTGLLGTVAARTGDTALALSVAERLAATRAPYLFGLNTLWRARIAAQLGRREGAVFLIRATLDEGYPFMPELLMDPAFEPLRSFGPYQELIRPKG